jgi:Animal haem peroxidase
MQRQNEVLGNCPYGKMDPSLPPNLSRCTFGAMSATEPRDEDSYPNETPPKFRFDYMLERRKFPQFDPQDLIDLGHHMEDRPTEDASKPKDHPSLSAGYTYLGQFITHDISFLKNHDVISPVLLTPDQLNQARSPSLDLDSLFGSGPDREDKRFYLDGSVKLKLGLTLKTGGGVTDQVYENDLPRYSDPSHENFRKAIIADERNDDNLALAQTHVAFAKFYNAVVTRLERSSSRISKAELFEQARQKVVEHYQWIILDDFLPKIIDQSILKQVIQEYPLAHYKVDEGYMPIEFAFAAFRFGHSLIRNSYSWNRFHPLVKVHELFELTGENGSLHTTSALPSDWIIDWTRFYDFSKFSGIPRNPKLNLARMIQTSLARSLKPVASLPDNILKKIKPEQYHSLTVMDLIRGNSVGLLTGQEAAEKLGVACLKEDDIARGPHEGFLREKRFHAKTPLWYYILKEAELDRDNRLGPVGSRIVAETFVGLIRASRISILPKTREEIRWRPDLGHIKPDEFSMTDLLMFVRKNSANPEELNPLG